jgi:hypothetical protein
MRKILAATIAGHEMQLVRQERSPRAAMEQAMGRGQHCIGRDQRPGAVPAGALVDAAQRMPRPAGGIERRPVVLADDAEQTVAGGLRQARLRPRKDRGERKDDRDEVGSATLHSAAIADRRREDIRMPMSG